MDEKKITEMLLVYAKSRFPKGCKFFQEDGTLTWGGEILAATLAKDESRGKFQSPCIGCYDSSCKVKGGLSEEMVEKKMMELSQGNIGSYSVCVGLYNKFGLQAFDKLTKLGIKGTNIWLLFKYQCNNDYNATYNALLNNKAIAMLQQNPNSSFHK